MGESWFCKFLPQANRFLGVCLKGRKAGVLFGDEVANEVVLMV